MHGSLQPSIHFIIYVNSSLHAEGVTLSASISASLTVRLHTLHEITLQVVQESPGALRKQNECVNLSKPAKRAHGKMWQEASGKFTVTRIKLI